MPRDPETKKPHKTSRPKAAAPVKKKAPTSETREAAARLAALLDGMDKKEGRGKDSRGKSARGGEGKVAGKSYGKQENKSASKFASKTAGKAGEKTNAKPASKGSAKLGAKTAAAKPVAAKTAKTAKAAAPKAAAPKPAKPAAKQGSKPTNSAKATRAKKPGPAADLSSFEGKSPCPVDKRCGGCKTIAMPYQQQLLLKNAAVVDLFDELGCDYQMLPILGMENPFHYRNKIISPFAPGKKIKRQEPEDGAKKRRNRGLDCEILTGMYEVGTHKLIPTNECLIENPVGKQVVLAVQSIMAKYGIPPYNEDAGEGFMRHVVVRVGHQSGEVLVTLVTNDDEFPYPKAFSKELIAKVPQVNTVVQNVNTRQTNVILGDEGERVLYGPGFILDTLCGLSFRISSTSFYQVNAAQTEVLYNTAMEFSQLTGKEVAIDAYCGTGTIGLVAASRGAKQVIGVESVEAAVRDARQNAAHNGIENATFVAADATQFMLDLAKDAEDFDPANTVLFMDPPRAGSTPEFLEAAAALGPARIVYVSCDPKTQVRDIEFLLKIGYNLAKVRPVDMFPHTDHVETVALLTRA